MNLGDILQLDEHSESLEPYVVLIAPEYIEMEKKEHAHLYECDEFYENICSIPICGDEELIIDNPIERELEGKTKSEELRVGLAQKHNKDGINICANCIRAIYAQ